MRPYVSELMQAMELMYSLQRVAVLAHGDYGPGFPAWVS